MFGPNLSRCGQLYYFSSKTLTQKRRTFFCVKCIDPHHRSLLNFVQSTGRCVQSEPLLRQNVYENTSNTFVVMKYMTSQRSLGNRTVGSACWNGHPTIQEIFLLYFVLSHSSPSYYARLIAVCYETPFLRTSFRTTVSLLFPVKYLNIILDHSSCLSPHHSIHVVTQQNIL